MLLSLLSMSSAAALVEASATQSGHAGHAVRSAVAHSETPAPVAAPSASPLTREAQVFTQTEAATGEQRALMAGVERLREGTWWEANRRIRPEFAQVGDLSFLLPLSDTPRDTSSEAGQRVLRLRDALRAHRLRQPAGWSRLVDAVRAARARSGELAAVTLANALVNEVRYRDGTDGSYYAPARFFAESGVCKDFAVAKYLLLKEAGFSVSSLRLVSLAPRYNNTPDDWHVVLVAQVEGERAPVVLDSPPPSAKRTAEANADAADVRTAGPSALLEAILAGRKPAEAVLRAPVKPAAAPVDASGQAERPLASVFNETGSRSFERDVPGGARAASASRAARGARAAYADETGQPWTVDASGTFPKWRVAANAPAAPAKAGAVRVVALQGRDE
jgi:predicted transglutaminase-like cysteine proteinase